MKRIHDLQPSRVLARLNLMSWPTAAVGMEFEFYTDDEIIKQATCAASAHPAITAQTLPAELAQLLQLANAEAGDQQITSLVRDLAGCIDRHAEVTKWYLAMVTALDELEVPIEEKVQAMDDVYAEAGWPEALWNLGQYNGIDEEQTPEIRMANKTLALRALREHLAGTCDRR